MQRFNRIGLTRGANCAIKNAHNSAISNRKEKITVYSIQFLNEFQRNININSQIVSESTFFERIPDNL